MNASELLEAPATTPRDEARRQVLAAIRELHAAGALARVHHKKPALYAQARRAFGSWREAVATAGIDYARTRDESLKRGLSLRDQRRAVWHALARFLVDHPQADDALLEAQRPELATRVKRCWGTLTEARAWAARK
jgi:hypothetical protein